MLSLARITVVPGMPDGASRVLPCRVRVRPATLVIVPGPLIVEPFTVMVVVALLKSGEIGSASCRERGSTGQGGALAPIGQLPKRWMDVSAARRRVSAAGVWRGRVSVSAQP